MDPASTTLRYPARFDWEDSTSIAWARLIRGINSSDRRRPGTGLGLYDALKVMKKHQGELNISSKPSLGNLENDYSNPFITNVIIQLPLIKPSYEQF